MIAGSNPAVKMLLKQDFWSILDQITYLACGLLFFKANIERVSAIPVAMGTRKQSFTDETPETFMMSNDIKFVSLFIRLDPAALG